MDIPANDSPGLLSPLEAIAASVTLKDHELLAAGPRREKTETVHDLVLLGFIGLFEFGLWTVTFATFGVPLAAAVPSALLIGAIIVAIDVRMTSSDTLPRGVLRQGRLPWSFFSFLVSRILISFILANITATACDLVLFRQEALQVMERDRDVSNRPLIAEYDEKLASLRAQEVGPMENEVADLTAQRSHALSEQSRADDKIVSVHEVATAADLENERQLNGVDASRGDGPLAKDAAKRRELAGDQARFLEAHQKDLVQDAARLSEQIAAAESRLAQAKPHYAEAERKLEQQRDGRLAKATAGPLTAVEGLIKLRDDPEQGAAVALVTVLSWSGIMVLELAFFLARTLFKPASVHDLAVNTDVKKRAALMAHELSEVLREAHRRHPLRVVGDDDANQ